MNLVYQNALRKKYETELRELLLQTFEDAQNLPELMHGIVVVQAAGNFCQQMKGNYHDLKKGFEMQGHEFGLQKEEYNSLVDATTTIVLDEFIAS